MTIRIFLFALCFSFLAFIGPDVNPFPQDFFEEPVPSQPMRLSGTFGELRPDHFHTGIDIKGGIGVPIYAAGIGDVARIRVDPDGYGNVLYLNHPNGFTTVYGHLNEFVPEIAAYVRAAQYAQESFVVDLTPPPGKFRVSKGEEIAKMGTTGHSFGPHLHFEIRETINDKPINPLLFGLRVTDRTAPQLYELKLYGLNDKFGATSSKKTTLKLRNGEYRLAVGDTLKFNDAHIGIALKTYDHMDGSSNMNGIYEIQMKVDDRDHYRFRTEAVDFKETRYINAHLDYAERVSHGSYYHRCFLLPGNSLSMYEQVVNRGMINIEPGQTKKINFAVRDVAGNVANGVFWVKHTIELQTPVATAAEPFYNYVLPFSQNNAIDNVDVQANFPKGTFYEDCYFWYLASTPSNPAVYSRVHKMHNSKVPVHDYFNLGIRPTRSLEAWKDKAFIAGLSSSNHVVNYGGTWKNGLLTVQTRTLGDYAIMIDTIPPQITPERFLPDMSKSSGFDFVIRDNFGTGGLTPNLQYRAEIDDRWVLMTYDEKRARIAYRFDSGIEPGNHHFKLAVWDSKGNRQLWEKDFKR
jgi:hypothetical protein